MTVTKGFGHETTASDTPVEWYTPAWVFEMLDVQFDLDPCAPAGGLPWITARQFYSLPQDGLKLPWQGKIWCNPPYGAETKKWLKRMNEHRNGIALVFARPDTDWFHAYAAKADAILFIKGRIKFVDKSGNPPLVLDKKTGEMKPSGPGAGSMLIAWGVGCTAALERNADKGFLVLNAPKREYDL